MQTLALESEYFRTHKNYRSRFLNVDFLNCPIESSIGVLGKKWAMQIIRDIGAYGIDRYNLLQKSLPGIPPKVLAVRLKQMEKDGYLMRTVEKVVPPMVVRWSLTEKGIDAVRIAMMFAAFGSKWNAANVFRDGKPRRMHEILNHEGMTVLTSGF